jgi:tRNA G10  N-methylase Trm11
MCQGLLCKSETGGLSGGANCCGLMAGRHFGVRAIAQDAGDARAAQRVHVGRINLRAYKIAGRDLSDIHGAGLRKQRSAVQ